MMKKGPLKTLAASREFSLLIVLVAIVIAITVSNPVFISLKNITDMLTNYSTTMILALGMMLVLLIGGIDISIGATIALSGMLSALIMRDNPNIPVPLAFLISLAVGLFCGLLTGAVIIKGKVPPIIATLGFMNIYRGLTYLVARNQWVPAYQIPNAYKQFATSNYLSFGLINNMITVMLVCYIIFYFFLRYTRTGRRIYATGSNVEAAQFSGINTDRIKFVAYGTMGLLSGLVGALWVSIYASAQGDMAMGIEMDVIAACVIGGVSLSGGRGNVVGVFLGALIMAILGNALPLVGISQFYQNGLKGLIILMAIILNALTQRSIVASNLRRRKHT